MDVRPVINTIKLEKMNHVIHQLLRIFSVKTEQKMACNYYNTNNLHEQIKLYTKLCLSYV